MSHPISRHKYIATAKRYSSDRQDPISNEVQERLITAFREKEAPESEVLLTWEGLGSAWKGVRQQLDDIYEDLKRHNKRSKRKITSLVLLNWSRFFRNMKEAKKYMVKFEEIGVEINTVERWIDQDTPEGQVMLTLELYQAQKYSDQTSSNIRNGNKERFARRVYCHKLASLFYRRNYHEPRRYTIEKVEPAFSASQKACREILYQGLPISQAHELNGGRELLGPLGTWREMIAKDRMAGLYKGEVMLMPKMLELNELHALRALFDGNKQDPKTKTTDYERYLLHGALICAKCGKPTTTSRPKSYNGTYIEYHVCHHQNPRHYRVQAGRVTTAGLEMIKELTTNAKTTKAVMEETKRIAKKDRAKAERNLKALQKGLNEAKTAYESATLKNALGKFTDAQLKMVENYYQKKVGEVEDAKLVIDHYGQILTEALTSINNVGSLIVNNCDPKQINDFLKMAFPSGLVYNEENATFRTSSINSCFTRTGLQSGSYHRIKLGGTPLLDAPPEVWRQTRLVRTPASDLKLFRAYSRKYG